MGQIKIIATFMHEYELSEALNVIDEKNRKVTDSFVIGTIDDSRIKDLKSKGLIVKVLQTPEAVTPAGFNNLYPTGHFKNLVESISVAKLKPDDSDNKNLIEKEGGDDFYILTITGPLLSEYDEILKESDIQLIESISLDSYTAFLTQHQHDDLEFNRNEKFYFVADIRLFDKFDTGVVFNNYTAKSKRKKSFRYFFTFAPFNLEIELSKNKKEKLLFDLLLHRASDMETCLQWLRQSEVEVVDISNQKIRISLAFDTTVINKIVSYKYFKAFEQYVPPVFLNNVAKEILHIQSMVGNNIVSHISQTGKGETIGVADTGIDHLHPDLKDAIAGKISLGRSASNDTTDPVGHGTHVAGSIVGNGKSSGKKIVGTAPGAKIFFQSLIDDNKVIQLPGSLDVLFEQAYIAGARIHNNSWGSDTPSTYTILSQDVDRFVHAKKDMLIVISAGNQGTGANPRNVTKGLIDLGSIGAPATAKNALTVGASRSTRTSGGYSTLTYGAKWRSDFPFSPISKQKISGNSESLAAFSSRGPTSTDFRIKPDLVAPGTDIISCKASSPQVHKYWGPYADKPDLYAYMGGTSMAAPLVTGCAALVREYYRVEHKHLPSAALLKATLINGTERLGGEDALAGQLSLPNYHQGFGLLNMMKTIPNVKEKFTLLFKDTWNDNLQQLQKTGKRFRYQFNLKGNGWLRICFAYTDDPALAIQNIVDISLENLKTKEKWTGNAERPEVGPVLSDRKQPDNVQIIRIGNVQPGKYLLQISAYSLLKPPQDFAFVISSTADIDNIEPYHAT